MTKFWSTASRIIRIIAEALHMFLNENGFYNYKPIWGDSKVLVRVKDKRVKPVRIDEARDCCWDFINNKYTFSDPDERTQVIDEFVKATSMFSPANINLLSEIKFSEVRDTKDKSFLFFKNCYLEVTAEKIIKLSYDSLQEYVWDGDVNQKDLISPVPDNYKPSGEFYEFFLDITKHPKKDVEVQNRESLLTLIGSLLHRFKDPANAKAIILMDSYIDGNPNGGTGKGLLSKAIGMMRTTAFQDGKIFQKSDKFSYSGVKYGTRLLVFDDVPKDFVVERKYENKFVIPFEESPKVLINTNYTVEGLGGSHKRRKVEFIFSDTYSAEYTPEDKFGHLLYNDWNQEEWDKFFFFMAYCLQTYLLMGILKPNFNVAERTLKINASKEFIEWANNELELAEKYEKRKSLEDFHFYNPGMPKIEQNTFTRWLRLYANAYGFIMTESHSGSENYFEFTNIKNENHENQKH
jgi:hypothetical protein